ncbi:MAG TPA: hypothetical protein VGF21_03275 [Thermoleophilaceae bacterium]
MTRYDWLLFLHVLSAFAIVGSVVVFTVVLLAARGADGAAALRLVPLARRLWDVGGAGTIVLGIWLAIDLDQYGVFDGWVIGAIVLWAVAAFAGFRLGTSLSEGDGGGAGLPYAVMTVAVAALLVVMIYKPGA